MDILAEHFTWDKFFDERYHCNYCSYDTQLMEAAKRHFAKRHAGELVIDQPAPDPDLEIQEEQQEQGDDNFILESEK